MTEMHVTDSIPAYALGTLSETERAEVALHLAGCPACRAELNAYQRVVEVMPLATPLKEPPTRLRARILNKAVAGQEATRRPLRGWRRWLGFASNPLAGLAGLFLVICLGALNVWQWQMAQKPAQQAGEFRLVHLSAAQNGSDATGILIVSEDGSFGTLVVDGLQALDASQQYQLWLIKDGKRTSGGVFSVLNSGYGMLRVDAPQPLSSYPSFGVTIEPAGGSPGPTGPKVLGGNF